MQVTAQKTDNGILIDVEFSPEQEYRYQQMLESGFVMKDLIENQVKQGISHAFEMGAR